MATKTKRNTAAVKNEKKAAAAKAEKAVVKKETQTTEEKTDKESKPEETEKKIDLNELAKAEAKAAEEAGEKVPEVVKVETVANIPNVGGGTFAIAVTMYKSTATTIVALKESVGELEGIEIPDQSPLFQIRGEATGWIKKFRKEIREAKAEAKEAAKGGNRRERNLKKLEKAMAINESVIAAYTKQNDAEPSLDAERMVLALTEIAAGYTELVEEQKELLTKEDTESK